MVQFFGYFVLIQDTGATSSVECISGFKLQREKLISCVLLLINLTVFLLFCFFSPVLTRLNFCSNSSRGSAEIVLVNADLWRGSITRSCLYLIKRFKTTLSNLKFSGPVSGDVFPLSYFQWCWMEAACGSSGSRPLEGSDSSDSYAKVFADVATRLPAECISSAALARGDAQDSDDEDPDQPVKKKRRCGHPSRVMKAMLRKGDELREQGRFRDALKVCETILSQNPDDEQICLLKSECYLALKDRKSAFEATKKVVECNPKHCKCSNWSSEQSIDCFLPWLIDWLVDYSFTRLIDWLIGWLIHVYSRSFHPWRICVCFFAVKGWNDWLELVSKHFDEIKASPGDDLAPYRALVAHPDVDAKDKAEYLQHLIGLLASFWHVVE